MAPGDGLAFSTPFDLKTEVHDGLAVVAVAGELDRATAPRLRAVLSEMAEPGRVILVDLSDTEFMDCAGLVPRWPLRNTSANWAAISSSTHRRERFPGSSNALTSTRW
jgi:hypothetical protein